MKATLTMLCVLAITLAGYSQEKSFNLNHYKFPDYKRHELELNFNSGGNNSKSSHNYYSSTGEIEKRDNSSSYNISHLTLGYQYDYLTRKRIDFLSSTLTGNYNYSKNKYDTQKEVNSSPSLQWNLYGSSKYYLIENKFFLEGFTSISSDWNKSKRTITGSPNDLYSHNYQNLTVGLGIGAGRMEKVSDLWQAYYMLEKLNKQGSFNRTLAEDDVFEFARLASRLKNQRFFDARLQKIEELKGLDSLLHQQGLITESDISYFTTLNDYWSYGNFQDRQSGMELVFRASPNYIRTYQKSNDNKANISDKTSIVSNAIFSYVKQLNLYWERRIGAGVTYDTMLDSTGTYFFDALENKYLAHAYLGYGYFPNSRTAISGSINYQGENIYLINQQNIKEDSWRNIIMLSLAGNYYFSPQLQISGNVSFNYYDREYNTSDRTSIYYSLGLRYAIF